ncbi:VIT family-domain-containing protein [Cercophora newfieldiana]|uniref:VIT family-domain-containing protein n=1 Tax=Cercophora newfieldiana TaxID=92897 RepID=A0AA39XXC9_9PEZI|nr:VIT family-domain-containing protein [Cercophora newfieldiana]
MSLVALKNFLFRIPSSSPREGVIKLPLPPSGTSSIAERRASHASTEATIVDLESQEPPRRGFQVTARILSDATIGLSDGLTVPFALTAGLSALGDTKVVIYGGLAELMAGAISMGLGGYLGAKSEIASYHETLAQTTTLATTHPTTTASTIRSVLSPYDLPPDLLSSVTAHLAASPKRIDFLMRFQHCAEPPASSRALTSALTIALAYFLGGLLPLVPYFCIGSGEGKLYEALVVSVGVMAVALFVFGYVKTGVVVGWEGARAVRKAVFGGVQMVLVGGAAAGAAMGLVKAFDVGVGEGMALRV